MKITKTYTVDWLRKRQRAKEEEKLFAEGWVKVAEEELEERDWSATCCLALIFFPLAFLPLKYKKIKVTYEKTDNK